MADIKHIPTLHRVTRASQVAEASPQTDVLYIVRHDVAGRIIKSLRWPLPRRLGRVVLRGRPSATRLAAMEQAFTAVAFGEDHAVLPFADLREAMAEADFADRFISGSADEESETLTLWRGDFSKLVVPFSAFRATGTGVKPDFRRFSVEDYGLTLRFGDYEAANDAVLYEFDLTFRRRWKKARRRLDSSVGGSIHRLRVQRRLRLSDFEGVGVTERTMGRIERGDVKSPRPATLAKIAERLGVPADEMMSY